MTTARFDRALVIAKALTAMTLDVMPRQDKSLKRLSF